ncbi:phosphoribosylaminoimidazolesuccinocarboxamide synthase [Propionicicella superfundia]|uniref:phosphoribosylaminoimidazolesuccinocarboxamide synthase n=1 Tax=Propionicicella superfundia TaxID=348582 RepID=UPI000414B55C|nr:phosphoribosylaminoimidazolesuccinocarboxamide synthase [Propionicicella superfundia]
MTIGEILHTGKVRRLHAVPGHPDRLLVVATDRISAFDHILAPDIPDKGEILTQLSIWWFSQLSDLVPNHLVSADVPSHVAGRAMLTERLRMIPVECVARGYLTGSGWAEYQRTQSVCGVPLPAGLQDGSKLPTPIFTPAIKAELGEHDENVDFDTIAALHGRDIANRLRDITLALYSRAERTARERGIILADTKFEFGMRDDGTIVLADEVLTPDSSRFWDAAAWRPGGAQPSFDKQFVRDWLAHESGWDPATDDPPPLPPEVVSATRARYIDAYERLVGAPFVRRAADARAGTGDDSPRVVVDVMPRADALDPQGRAVTSALQRVGFDGLTVRQGKRFEIEVAGDVTTERLDEIRAAADRVLANAATEVYDVHVVP